LYTALLIKEVWVTKSRNEIEAVPIFFSTCMTFSETFLKSQKVLDVLF